MIDDMRALMFAGSLTVSVSVTGGCHVHYINHVGRRHSGAGHRSDVGHGRRIAAWLRCNDDQRVAACSFHCVVLRNLRRRTERQLSGRLRRLTKRDHAYHNEHLHRQLGRVGHHEVSVGGAVHSGRGHAAELAVRRGDVPRRADDARSQRSRVDVDINSDRRRPLLRHRPPVPTSNENQRLSTGYSRCLAHVTVHILTSRYIPEGQSPWTKCSILIVYTILCKCRNAQGAATSLCLVFLVVSL